MPQYFTRPPAKIQEITISGSGGKLNNAYPIPNKNNIIRIGKDASNNVGVRIFLLIIEILFFQ